MKILPFILIIFLFGCGVEDKYYKPVSNYYKTNLNAVVSFYKDNYPIIKSMSDKQEIMGYTVKCEKGYKYTNYIIGGLVNTVSFDVELESGCGIYSVVHTHPLPPKGLTSDLFSPQDLQLSRQLPVYLLSLENDVLRVTNGDDNKYGIRLGTINKENK